MSSVPWKRILTITGKLALACGLLVWLARSGRLQLGRLLSVPFDRRLFLFVVLNLCVVGLPVIRWWWLLRIQRISESLANVTTLTWTSHFLSLVLPGAASGDLVKSYLILRLRPHMKARAFSTVLADRFIGLYALMLVGTLGIIWLASTEGMAPAVRVMASAILVLFVGVTFAAGCLFVVPGARLFLWALPSRWRDAWSQSFDLYRANLWPLSGCLILSVASSAAGFGSLTVASWLIGEDISWAASFVAGPLIGLANCLPLTPGGIGTGEAASSELFACLGSARGAEVMVLLRLAGVLVSIPGVAGLWFLPRRTAGADPAGGTVTNAETVLNGEDLSCVELGALE